MKEQNEERNTEMGSVITRSEEFIQKNQKMLIIAAVAVVVVVLAIFGLRKWYFQPREVRASEEMFAAEQWYAQGEFQKALEGDGTYRGFNSLISEYGSTKAGNLAKYYSGICNLRLGNYDEAVRMLKKYSGKDTFTKAIATMALGDAEMEQGNVKEAAAQYAKAARESDNFVVAPSALFKAGMAYVMLDNKAEAKKCFEAIKTKYPESTEWADVDKYLALTE